MNILALDTSGPTASLTILESERDKVWSKELQTPKGISEILTIEIDQLLSEAKLEINDFNLIAVGIGPGSYTGTRVGIATAKGLAQGLEIPIIGITSFESLIKSVEKSSEDEIIIPLVDARNDRVYYQIDGEIGCDNIEEVLKKLKNNSYVFVGTGATANRELLTKLYKADTILEEQDQIQSKFIAQIADSRAQNNLFDDIVALKPLYVNKPNVG